MARRTPISEQRRLVALWRGGEQSMVRFAASHGVAKSTFWCWTRKHGDPPSTDLTIPEFVELTADPVPTPVSVHLELQGARALALAFDQAPDPTWFGAVLREVCAC